MEFSTLQVSFGFNLSCSNSSLAELTEHFQSTDQRHFNLNVLTQTTSDTKLKHAEIRKLLNLLFYIVAIGFVLFELVIVFYSSFFLSFFLVLVPLFLSNTVLNTTYFTV